MVQALVRSQGQIFFQRATLSGVLVLVAMAVASPWLAVFALLGAASQTGPSLLLRRPAGGIRPAASLPADNRPASTERADGHPANSHPTSDRPTAGNPCDGAAPARSGSRRASALAMSSLSMDATVRRDAADGIHGFCGALTGCAAFLACGPTGVALAWTVLGGVLCALLVRVLERLRVFDWLPMLTGPFCAVNSALTPLFAAWHRDASPPSALPGGLTGPLIDVVLGTVRAAAQVVLADDWVTGALVLVIMFLAGTREGLWSLTGAALSTVLGFWALGGDPAIAGLAGYSGFLTALALGAVFPRNDAARPVRVLVPLIAAAVTVPLWWVLSLTGVAVYTWPFVLTTWTVLIGQRKVARRRGAGAAS